MTRMWLLVAALTCWSVGGALCGKLAESHHHERVDNPKDSDETPENPRVLFELLPDHDTESLKECAIMEDSGLCFKVAVDFSVLDRNSRIGIIETTTLFNRTKVEVNDDGTNKTFHYIGMDDGSNAVFSLTTSSGYPQLNGYATYSEGNITGDVWKIVNCGQDCHVIYDERVSF